jgi:hypothetical protein
LLSNGQPVVTRYELTFYQAGTSQAVASVDLGKPSPQADGVIRLDFTSRMTSWPPAGVQVDARVGAIGPDGTAVTNPSNVFVFTSATTSTIYLGDVAWTSMTNGWGPVERNRSNGEQGATDGRTITLNGRTYAKGLGAHARSDVRYALNGACTTFQADIGVDDEMGANGSIVFEVWADGTRLYSSPIMQATTATQPVNVNVSGKRELALIITDAGNGIGADHGDWADARVSCAPSTSTATSLSDLAWTSMTNGWGPVEKDRSNGEKGATDGRTITLNGKTYAKGLGAHASSDVRYALNGSCSMFQSDIGVDDETGTAGRVVFQVWADGAKLFDSGVMTGATATRTVSVDVSGRNQLALVITDAGNGFAFDHGDWANARVVCSSAVTTNTGS